MLRSTRSPCDPSALTAKGSTNLYLICETILQGMASKVEELPLAIDKAQDKEFKDQEVLDQEFSKDF